MKRSPYTYPHKSKHAQIDYLTGHDAYGGWNHPNRGWSPLSWNVRIGNADFEQPKGEYQLDPSHDDAWAKYVEKKSELFYWACEDMARQYTEGEYTTYPGDDQGDWEFCFAGRSGGQMLLAKWKGTDFLRSFDSAEHWRDWLTEGIDTAALRTLYRAVRCMDHDLRRDAINAEFEYQLNFRRHEFEEEREVELAAY